MGKIYRQVDEKERRLVKKHAQDEADVGHDPEDYKPQP